MRKFAPVKISRYIILVILESEGLFGFYTVLVVNLIVALLSWKVFFCGACGVWFKKRVTIVTGFEKRDCLRYNNS